MAWISAVALACTQQVKSPGAEDNRSSAPIFISGLFLWLCYSRFEDESAFNFTGDHSFNGMGIEVVWLCIFSYMATMALQSVAKEDNTAMMKSCCLIAVV